LLQVRVVAHSFWFSGEQPFHFMIVRSTPYYFQVHFVRQVLIREPDEFIEKLYGLSNQIFNLVTNEISPIISQLTFM